MCAHGVHVLLCVCVCMTRGVSSIAFVVGLHSRCATLILTEASMRTQPAEGGAYEALRGKFPLFKGFVSVGLHVNDTSAH